MDESGVALYLHAISPRIALHPQLHYLFAWLASRRVLSGEPMHTNHPVNNEAERIRKRSPQTLLPETIGGVLWGLLGFWLGLALLALAANLIVSGAGLYTIAAFGVSTLIIAAVALKVARAKRRVLTERDVPILFGLAHLVAWDPVEGALFLRDKNISFVDDCLEDGCGGIRCIYPMFGDELALQVPLEVQTLKFADDKVLTREYLSVTIRGSIKWQVTDLRRYYLRMSRELRSTGELADRGRRPDVPPVLDGKMPQLGDTRATQGKLMTAAIEWLRLLAEEETRTQVSRVSSGLLIAERMSEQTQGATAQPQNDHSRLSALPAAVEGQHAAWRSAAETLAESISRALSAGVQDSGISIVSVSLQEIQMPEEIVVKCIEAAQAAYLPLLAQRQASLRRADLAAEVDMLGREAVGTKEILGAAPSFTLVEFLSQFVTKQLSNPTGAGAAIATAGAIAAGEAARHQLGQSP